MVYIAHIRESDKEIQELSTHLLEAKSLAETSGSKIGLKHVAGLCGLLHDVGKYSPRFQKYIFEAVFQPEDTTYSRGEVDHSTAGGKLIYELLHSKNNSPQEKLLSEIVSNAIISHHSNLKDYLSIDRSSAFISRVLEKDIPDYEYLKTNFFEDTLPLDELKSYIHRATEELSQFPLDYKTSVFLTKYIFSCLIDADRTNTREFEEGTTSEVSRKQPELFNGYYNLLMKHMNDLKRNAPHSTINELRNEMSEQCEAFAYKPSGIYTLSIPTGGGKTLASFRYALKHSLEYHKQRIIYVVPYTTIIEQNAEEIKNIVDDDSNVLEHHSNVIEDKGDKSEFDVLDDGLIDREHKLRLAKDNWDSPVIFTTLVQFLNVFYAKGNRNTRRLHNLAHSVVIFDEVQKVPTHCISLFNEAVNFLKNKTHSSVLLCTATQPTLENVTNPMDKDIDGEIVMNLDTVTESFKRVEINDMVNTPMTNQSLAEWVGKELEDLGSTLIILNTKSVVKELYELLKEKGIPTYHLSTSMCAAHRKEKLEVIRKSLEQDEPFVCVTTQLIEAGVDVSFNCVIRSIAGLDSIAQAAGRCNRHGEHSTKPVYVINHQQEKLSPLKDIKAGKEAAYDLLARYRNQPGRYEGGLLSQKVLKEYFNLFYDKRSSELSYPVPDIRTDLASILFSKRVEEIRSYQTAHSQSYPLIMRAGLETASEYFNVIEDNTTSILVPYERGKTIIAELNSNRHIHEFSYLLKNAQHYSVQVYPQIFQHLANEQALVSHYDGMIYELKESFYDEEYGLDVGGNSQVADLIF